jgi:hypothetical protein
MAKPLKIKKISRGDKPQLAAKRILRARIKEFYSHWDDPDRPPTPDQLHNLRISGKRLRYSAESLRELYPDRLTLLIEILKRSQDLLGDIQDCVTQRGMLLDELTRLRRRRPQSDQIAILENIMSEFEQRQVTLFAQFRDTWRSMSMEEFRDCLKVMASRVKKIKRSRDAESPPESQKGRAPSLRAIAAADSLPVDQTGDEARAEPVVDIDDRDV